MNTFGQYFRVTTWGESHGPAIGVVIDGCPPGIGLTPEEIQVELNRRRPGQSRLTTSRNEEDRVQVMSGIYHGKTTGTPISLMVLNRDARSAEYDELKDVYRPGHADFTYRKKYGIRDHRGSGRASGRETLARVAAGAVASKILAVHRIFALGFTRKISSIEAKTDGIIPDDNITPDEWKRLVSLIEASPVRCPDSSASRQMADVVQNAADAGDSVGGIVEVRIFNVPAGLGDPVFNKADAVLAHALLSVGATKGIEFGKGFAFSELMGSEANDPFVNRDGAITLKTNNCGGILGGISVGTPVVARVVVKPTSSISKEQQSVRVTGEEVSLKITGRHDPCIVIRIVPVLEHMANIAMADLLLSQTAIHGKYPA